MSKSSMTTLCSRPYNSFRSSHGISCSLKQNHNASSPVTHAIKTKMHSSANALITSSSNSADNNNNSNHYNNKKTTATRTMTEAVDIKKSFPKKTTTVWGARSSFNMKNSNSNSMTNSNSSNYKQIIDNKLSSCAIHLNSPNSSGTSLESIVPKYQKNTNPTMNGANKRSIITKPQKRSYNTSSSFNKINSTSTSANRKVVTLTVEGRIAKKCKEKDSKDTLMRSPFSDKFPMGLPFEDEFYRPSKRSSSIYTTATSSSYADRPSSCSSSVLYEDEFNRKPSLEPLYVDYTKRIPSDDIPDYHNESYYKFERISKYYKGDAVITREEPAVYLAVASWVPKCNQICFETKKMETKDWKENG